jgi:hypothetical protein
LHDAAHGSVLVQPLPWFFQLGPPVSSKNLIHAAHCSAGSSVDEPVQLVATATGEVCSPLTGAATARPTVRSSSMLPAIFRDCWLADRSNLLAPLTNYAKSE